MNILSTVYRYMCESRVTVFKIGPAPDIEVSTQPPASSTLGHVDITSDTTASSDGLTRTTVSSTSLLWCRVLCPEGED